MKDLNNRMKAWSDTRGISGQQPFDTTNWTKVVMLLKTMHFMLRMFGVSGYILNKIEELIEYAVAFRVHNMNDVIDAIADSSVFDDTELLKHGLDPIKVREEVLKVLEARRGTWDRHLGKFVKDKSATAKARWYNPVYYKNCVREYERTGSLFGHERHMKAGCDSEEHS